MLAILNLRLCQQKYAHPKLVLNLVDHVSYIKLHATHTTTISTGGKYSNFQLSRTLNFLKEDTTTYMKPNVLVL